MIYTLDYFVAQAEKARAWDGLTEIMNRHSRIVSQALYSRQPNATETSDDVLAMLFDFIEANGPRPLEDVAL